MLESEVHLALKGLAEGPGSGCRWDRRSWADDLGAVCRCLPEPGGSPFRAGLAGRPMRERRSLPFCARVVAVGVLDILKLGTSNAFLPM